MPVVEGNSGKLLPAKGTADLRLPHCTDEQTEALCSSPTASNRQRQTLHPELSDDKLLFFPPSRAEFLGGNYFVDKNHAPSISGCVTSTSGYEKP